MLVVSEDTDTNFTRMHPSRMRTARFSGHPGGGGVCLGGWCLPGSGGICLGEGCTPSPCEQND